MNEAIAPENNYQPAHWSEALLGDIAEGIKAGKSFRCIERPPTTGEKGIVKISAVTWGRFQDEESKTVTEPERLDPSSLIEENDLLISRANTIELVGASVLATKTKKELYLSDKVLRIEIEDNLKKWVHYFLSSPSARTYISESSTGNQLSMRNISQKALLALKIPFPPLNEQRRIADKLDTTLAAVEACKQKLNSAAETTQRFRQAVLTAAVSGELTREWRKENGLSGDWDLRAAKDVCTKVQSGGTPKEGFTEEGVPFLKVYNIVDQEVSFDYKPQFIDLEIHLSSMKKSRCIPGDVLMNIVGPPLGKVAIVPDSFDEWNINQAITLFRPSKEITTEWLYLILCEGSIVREIELTTKGSAGQKNISLTQCREFKFSCPSIEEQLMAWSLAENLFKIASNVEERIDRAANDLERVTPAILAKAFRGELVPQDPSDEPASVLLERIQSQRRRDAEEEKSAKKNRKAKSTG